MRHGLFLAAALALAAARVMSAETGAHVHVGRIPGSIQAEHEEIQAALAAAAKAPGRVGEAAKTLAVVLRPHFEREEQVALPPLGVLGYLAAGETLPEELLAETQATSAKLRSELPRMLQEHKRIRAAVEELREAARLQGAPEHERFAERLAAHARMEEEVLYPAAIVVGDLIRARRPAK